MLLDICNPILLGEFLQCHYFSVACVSGVSFSVGITVNAIYAVGKQMRPMSINPTDVCTGQSLSKESSLEMFLMYRLF